jgi:hypothetical protein
MKNKIYIMKSQKKITKIRKIKLKLFMNKNKTYYNKIIFHNKF